MSVETATTFDQSLVREIRTFLRKAPASSGVCLELDPRWLLALQDGLDHQPYALITRTGKEISGYLPLALVKSALFGRFLVSLPYLNRAGIVAQDDATATALLEAATQLAIKLNVQYLELRHHALCLENPLITHSKDEKVRMLLELPDSPETLFKKLGTKLRTKVRKGDKLEFSLRWGSEDLLTDFYHVFSINMRDLGTPVYSKKLFSSILHHFRKEAELAVVYFKEQPIACALLIHDDELEHSTQVPSASSLRAFNYTKVNMWMYYQLLSRAIQHGNHTFDFGRSSKDSGTYRFKKQWGALPHPTVWQYHLRHGALDAARPDNPRMQRRIEAWKKMPVWLTRLIGPGIVRGIP